MAASPGEQDVLRDLRARSYAEGGIFWLSENDLAVFDPDAAQQINSANFSDLVLPDKLGDLLRGRDPDRWLHEDESATGTGSGARYVPFGWAPRGCIGAGLGTAQLILLCHLMTTRFRVQL